METTTPIDYELHEQRLWAFFLEQYGHELPEDTDYGPVEMTITVRRKSGCAKWQASVTMECHEATETAEVITCNPQS